MRVKIIIPYFGKTPTWLPFFLSSCKANKNIHWLIYSDLKINSKWEGIKNLQIEKKTLNDFNNLASRKLSINVSISIPYKICDFKPAFGIVFSDYIVGYDYWGYCDIDMIFGRLSVFLPMDKQYDIITSGERFLSGSFTLYRNKSNITTLFQKIWKIKSKLSDQKRIYYLDEDSNYIGRRLSDKPEERYKELKNIYEKIINSLRFRFLKTLPFSYDIAKVIEKEKKVQGLKIYRLNDSESDNSYIGQNIKTWKLIWEKGKLKNLITGNEMLYYHFLKSKDYIKVGEIKKGNNFIITDTSIGS